jgi:hypothetical protein
MVDITSVDTNALGETVSAGFSTSMIYLTVGLLIVGLIGLILWSRYLKSFNHMVVIKRPTGVGNDFEFDMGYKGRYIFSVNDSTKDQQMVFQIFQAKKHKFNWTEGPVERDYRVSCMIKGRRQYMIIMSPDKDGFLHPIKLTSNEKGMLESQISQGAISFAAKAIDNIAMKYRQQDFLQKYGLLIFIILILIIAALFWWGTKNNAEAMESIAGAVAAQSQTQSDLTELINGLVNGTVKLNPPQTVTVIS